MTSGKWRVLCSMSAGIRWMQPLCRACFSRECGRARVVVFTAVIISAFMMCSTILAQDNAFEDIPDAVVKRVDPSVVAIQHKRAAGSGFVVTQDGYILSNGHVVRGDDKEDPMVPAKAITVILNDERKYPARVLGFCMDPDVALLKIEADEPLHPVEFADTRRAQIGQKCFAVGTPVGLKRTFTSGMLSNVDRTDLGTFTKVFQTDAAINPGNSGGPLFDREGRVLGVNTYASSGQNNLGFTIPSHVVKVLWKHLKEYGRFRRVDLPLFLASEIYDELAAALKVDKGILVSYVMKGSAAEQAGLQSGDIITKIDGKTCFARTRAELMEFGWEFSIREPGTPIEMTVLRGPAEKRKAVLIKGDLELDEPQPNLGRFPGEVVTHYYDALGLGFKDIMRLHRVFYGLTDEPGVLVSWADRNQPAQKADLFPGSVIGDVEGVVVGGVESFQKELEKHLRARKKAIDLGIRRGKMRCRTAIVPYYDMKDRKALLIVPRGGAYSMELILRELTADGALITVATEDGVCNFVDSRTPVAKLPDVKGKDYDFILLVDGVKARDFWNNADALRVVREVYAEGGVLSAVGSSSITLIEAEPELKETRITTDKDFSSEALKRNALYTGNDLEKDGKVLTTTGFEREDIRDFLKALRIMIRNLPVRDSAF